MRFMKDGSRAMYPYRDFSLPGGHALAMKKALDIRSDFNIILGGLSARDFPPCPIIFLLPPLFSSLSLRISALNGSRERERERQSYESFSR